MTTITIIYAVTMALAIYAILRFARAIKQNEQFYEIQLQSLEDKTSELKKVKADYKAAMEEQEQLKKIIDTVITENTELKRKLSRPKQKGYRSK